MPLLAMVSDAIIDTQRREEYVRQTANRLFHIFMKISHKHRIKNSRHKYPHREHFNIANSIHVQL